MCVCVCVCVCVVCVCVEKFILKSLSNNISKQHDIYICVCVCVCVLKFILKSKIIFQTTE